MNAMQAHPLRSEPSLRAAVRRLVGMQVSPPRTDIEAGEDLAADLGLDSVGILELMSALEDAFAMAEVPETQLLSAATVGDIEDLVVRYAARPATASNGTGHAIR
jgi:acyl carrier protein